MSRLSLRARLLLGVLALALVGVAAADAVTYTELRSFLLTRVDRTLDDDHQGAESLEHNGSPDFRHSAVPGEIYVQIRSSTGQVLYTSGGRGFPGTEAPSPPKLPKTIAIPAQPSGQGPDRVARFTVPAANGDGNYRVRASVDPGSTDVLVLATSLSDVNGTLHRLLLIELIATLAVLLAVGALGLWIVRLGLRPLERIGRTADGIAGGDLSHRVAPAEERTEVGRLGLALNSMLDRLEESDQRLRQFVADASHELRTPLAAVRAYAELFDRGAAGRPDDLARAMAGIGRESERMSELVEDLLLLARLDEGRAVEREPVALDDVAREAVDTARALDSSHPFELELEPAIVLGDGAAIRRVFDNLLGNVRSHTPAGTSAIVRVAVSGNDAVIEVADEGPGLPAGELDDVFRRFHRADPSRARVSGGVGLGLSIVSAIAAAHGGTASVTSAPGEGATFRVVFPRLAELS